MPRRARMLTVGQKYGKLTVLRFVGVDSKGHGVHEFVCDCGRTRQCRTRLVIMKRNGSPSCGHFDCTDPHGVDLSGRRFGRLTVIKRMRDASGKPVYECKCDCGKTKMVRNGRLKGDHIKSCGCMQKDAVRHALSMCQASNDEINEARLISLVGRKFGQLTIRKIGAKGTRKRCRMVFCECDCGGHAWCSLSSLRQGGTVRCRNVGCCRNEHNLAGKRFGRLTVIRQSDLKYSNGKQKVWECKCDCGRNVRATTHELNKKKRSCGKGSCHHQWRGGKNNIGSEAWCRMRLARIGICSRVNGYAGPYETWEIVRKLWEKCEGKCACCKRKTKKALVLDHCHKTGRLRGFVCNACNTAIGLLDECPIALRRASDYVAKECVQRRLVLAQ